MGFIKIAKIKKQSFLIFRLLVLFCLAVWSIYLPIWPDKNPATAVVSFIPANQIITYGGIRMKIGDINGDSKQDIVLGDQGYVNTSSVWTLIQTSFGPSSLNESNTFFSSPIYNVNNSGYNDYVWTAGWAKNNYATSSVASSVVIDNFAEISYGESVGNLDGDAYSDFVEILFGSWSNIKVRILECDNNNCEYPFLTSYTIDNSFLFAGNHRCQAESIIKDFNNDGLNDIFVAAGGLARFYTNAGAFSFTSTTYVDGTDCGYHYPTTGDVDGDNYQDFVYFNYTGDILYWRQNDQNPSNGFGTQYTIDATLTANGGEYFSDGIVTASSSAYIKDIDGDGDSDIAVANSAGNAVYWYENDGTPADGGWVKHTVDSSIANPSGVGAEDFNNDGLVDIVASNASGVYFYAHNNPPALQSISTTASTTGSGYVNVSIGVGDVELGETKLKILYKAGADCSGAVSSTSILVGSASATYNDSGGVPLINNSFAYQIGSSTTQSVVTTPATNTVQFVWDSKIDVPTADGTYCLAILANDSYVDSNTSTVNFTLDNLAPTAPGALTTSTISTSSVTLTFGATTTETNFLEYKIFYKAGASGVGESDTAFTSSSDAHLGNRLFSGFTTTSISNLFPNTQYVFNIWAYDTYGNKASSTQELAFYTSAVVPSAPTVTASTTSASALQLIINTNGNGVTTQYAICQTIDGATCIDDGSYIQSTGATSTVQWQTYAQWGGASGQAIINLNANASYKYIVKARNASLVETAFSASGSATTIASPVTSLLATNTTNTTTLQLQLTWTDVNSNGLKIDQDNNCNGVYDQTLYDQTTATATQPFIVSSTISANTCYRFRVSSYNVSSTLNSSIAPTIDLTTPPSQPTGLTTSAVTSTNITWVWNAVTDAVGYYLFNSVSNVLIAEILSPTVEYFNDSLTPNTLYSVILRAYNANGTGIASSVASTYTTAGIPTGVQLATSTANTITWQWNNGGQSEFFAQDKNNPTNNSGWLASTTLTWQQTGLATNTAYTVQIKAKNESGVETGWSEASGYTMQAAPTGITFVSSTTGGINVQVNGTFYNLGGLAKIYFDNGVGANSNITSGNNWDNTGLNANTQYTYTIYATNGSGVLTVSVQSATYTLTNIPSTLTAIKDPTTPTSKINLTWSGDGTNYYAEYSKTTGGAWLTLGNSGWIALTNHSFTSLDAGIAYYFRVKAKNATEVETNWSSEATASTDSGGTPPCTSNCGPGTPPGVSVTGAISINNNAVSTANREVSVLLTSNATNYFGPVEAVYNSSTGQFSACDFNGSILSTISASKQITFTLSSATGTKRLCVRFDNGASSIEKTAEIILQSTTTEAVNLKESCQNYPPNFISFTDIDGKDVPIDGNGSVHLTYNNSVLALNFKYNDCPYYYDSYRLYVSNQPFSEVNEGKLWSTWSLFGEHIYEDKNINFPTDFVYKVLTLRFGQLPEKLYLRLLYTLKGELTYGEPAAVNIIPMSNQEFCDYFPGQQYMEGNIYLLSNPFPFIPAFVYSKICLTSEDTDKDGIINKNDNCPTTYNLDQADKDKDGIGDACDPDETDLDQDGIPDSVDSCLGKPNQDQLDSDKDGLGDACDRCPVDPKNDFDGDTVCGNIDNCPLVSNFDQKDTDQDGLGNVCDVCPDDKFNDGDKDGICGAVDLCPNDPKNDQDKDGVCGDVDPCPSDATNQCQNCVGSNCPCVGPDCPCVGPTCPCTGPNCPCVGPTCPCVGSNCGLPQITEPEKPPCVGIYCQPCQGDSCKPNVVDPIVTSIVNSIVGSNGNLINILDQTLNLLAEIISGKAGEFISNFSVQKLKDLVKKEILDNPQVEKAALQAAPYLATVGLANVVTGFGLPEVIAFARSLFTQPLLILRKRKQKKWGVIYDAFTKQPVDLATIRVINKATDNVVRSQVTDAQGRYYLILEPGAYQLEVNKFGYQGSSAYLHNIQEDSNFINLYHGEVININQNNTALNYNIPLDAVSQKASLKEILKDKTVKFSHYIIGLTGLVASGLSFAVQPSPLISGFFFTHLFFFGISYQVGFKKIIRPTFGSTLDAQTKEPLAQAVVRIFDAEYNKLVASTITDKKGRYAMLVGPSKYYVTFDKSGYQSKRSPIIDLSSDKTHGMGGMIQEKVEMERIV